MNIATRRVFGKFSDNRSLRERSILHKIHIFLRELKAHDGNRTHDLFLTKEVLCRLSYVGEPCCSSSNLKPASRTGAGNGTRTRDPELGRLALYQLSYSRSPCRP